MKREKIYNGQYLRDIGWKKLISLSQEIFGQVERITCAIYRNSGVWAYDNLEDFIADLNPENSDLFMHFSKDQTVRLCHYIHFKFEITTKEKTKIVQFETQTDNIVSENLVPHPEPEIESKTPTIFIGHGKHNDWRDLKDHLQDKHNIPIIAYEVGSRAGHTIRDVLEDMLNESELAILVHTPEDELSDGSFNTRPNVVHETGIFQGRLGFSKAIILLKIGVNEFTNIDGIQQLRYKNISETFGDILAWIAREHDN